MAASFNTSTQTAQGQDGNRFALVSLTMLFFMWGFITCLNDILIPHLKNVFDLNYTQAMLIQFCFFGAYFIVSLPAGYLVKSMGYKRGLVTGLLVAAVGCLLFYPAASLHTYPLFLGALFVLAAGITILQVAANPYVTILGKPETASSRLNLTQAFNSMGTTLAPLFGGMLILTAAGAGLDAMDKAAEADAVKGPYLMLAAVLVILAAIFSRLNLPNIQDEQLASDGEPSKGSAFQYRHLVLGAVGIFVYVGAEVSIGSFLVNFLGEANIAGLAESEAAHYVAYYWGGAMIGRLVGSFLMTRFAPGRILAINSVIAAVLVATAMTGQGSVAMYAILLVGLCNSIMFPTIFSLALKDLGPHTSQGSGILCLAIVGGAILPLLQGNLADHFGIQTAFILPFVCYLFIAFYGEIGSKPKLADSAEGEAQLS